MTRTHIIWLSFIAAMTIVTGLLAIGDGDSPGGFPATRTGLLSSGLAPDVIFDIDAPIDSSRWDGIVVHHSASPAGDAKSLDRLHRGYGYDGLGYHFLIGNGNGLGDGTVHVGYRWNEQKAGAHTAGRDAARYNERMIGICLIGNGDQRPFTQDQIAELISLVQRLQKRFDIAADQVYLHRDLAPVSSPGRFFPAATLREQLVD
ncbi:MAG: N-acetylmuramoyl-L-alanine amidase [Phycisphaerales bacterium]|nr:N-acetylmuramoyl-L-alanine amidase [Phycisphaerales bacterium]MCA9295501.1 N-acetylmuramoyl-L-alanine amidase [Phycisphaerales bacterium]